MQHQAMAAAFTLLSLLLLAGPASAQLSATHDATLNATDQGPYDQLGWSVAIDADGTRVIAGSLGRSSADSSAHVFVRVGTAWSEEAVLPAPTAAIGAGQVAISADGATAIVGYYGDALAMGERVHVYARTGASWTDAGTLTIPAAVDGVVSSNAVAIDGTGNVAVVAASGRAGTPPGAGGLVAFVRVGSSWTFEGAVVNGTEPNEYVGTELALSADGMHVVTTHDTPDGRTPRGYTRSGSSWSADAAFPAAPSRTFVTALAVDADGTHAIAGSEDEGGSGVVRVFAREGTAWSMQGLLSPERITTDAHFGTSVGISGDGDRAVVGAHYTGTARLFSSDGVAWVGERTIPSPESGPPGLFGSGVALSTDGVRLVVGAGQYVVSGDPQVGRAYVFTLTEPAPTPDAGPPPDAYVAPPPPPPASACGCRVGGRSAPLPLLVLALALVCGMRCRRI